MVGVNGWVVHRDKGTFGDDIEQYRPERWLEASKEKLNEMNRTMFQFATGNHICLGRNISLLEIYKLVPSVMRTFRVRSTPLWVSDPPLSFTVDNHMRRYRLRMKQQSGRYGMAPM